LSITFINKTGKTAIGAVHMKSGRCKHTAHLTEDQQDSIEWGEGGHCDNDPHDVSFKVDLTGPDAHPLLEGVKNTDTVTLKYDDGRPDGRGKHHPLCDTAATYHVGSHRGYYIVKN